MTDYKDKIICGDCLELLKELPDNYIDLTVTSPPYNIGIGYENYKDEMPWKDYYLWCEEWISELMRVTKEDGRICINHYLSFGSSNNRHSPLMKINSIAENIGLKHHAVAVWEDATITKRTAWGSWLNASAPYINSPYEGILILYKNRWKKDKSGITQITPKEFMDSCTGKWKIHPEHNREHPAPFPLRLAERCILLLSYENDLILDPFIGSGTVAAAAIKWNRDFIGFEISEEYVALANKRIQPYLNQTQLF